MQYLLHCAKTLCITKFERKYGIQEKCSCRTVLATDFNRALLHRTTQMADRAITLLFQQPMPYKISRLLGKFNTKIVHKRAKKSLRMVSSMKGDLGLKVSGGMQHSI